MTVKKCIALVLLAVFVLTLFGCGGGTSVVRTRWVIVNGSESVQTDSWGYTAARLSGNSRRDINFSAEDLANLHIDSSNSEGSIALTMTQGDVEEVIDLSGEFFGSVDTSRFEAGRIRLSLRFDSARDVDFFMGWAAVTI